MTLKELLDVLDEDIYFRIYDSTGKEIDDDYPHVSKELVEGLLDKEVIRIALGEGSMEVTD